MELKIKDVAEMLRVSEKTIYRWIKDKKIPVYQFNSRYRFKRTEIADWMQRNHRELELPERGDLEAPELDQSLAVSELVKRGGIYYKVEGDSINSLIQEAMNILPQSASCNRAALFASICERELMMPTALVEGIAFPHARVPMIALPQDEYVAICFSIQPISYRNLSVEKVHTLIFPLLSSLERHLIVLTKLLLLCRDARFLSLLESQAPRGEIITAIQEAEQKWKV